MTTMTIVDYSDKSFVLTGDTKIYKDEIKRMNGRWNPFLKEKGIKQGWVFRNADKGIVSQWLSEKIGVVDEGGVDCSICQADFIEPITLSCGHEFCALCFFRYSYHMETETGHDINCPTCRHVIIKAGDLVI